MCRRRNPLRPASLETLVSFSPPPSLSPRPSSSGISAERVAVAGCCGLAEIGRGLKKLD